MLLSEKKIIHKHSNPKNTLKFQLERLDKVKKLIHAFIQDNNVEIVSDDQIYYENKNQNIMAFADKLKFIIETKNKNKNIPMLTVEEYVNIILQLNSDTKYNSNVLLQESDNKLLTVNEIYQLTNHVKLSYAKSLAQAEEFLQHILFRLPDASGAIKVVAKRYYDVVNSEGQSIQLEKDILLPGYKNIKDYEETLKHIPVRSHPSDKPQTYWDVFSKSKAVLQASHIYNPKKDLYWCDEFKHYYINSYKEPEWKDQPLYYHLMQKHKTDPLTFSGISDILRSFLSHLFPDELVRREVLKWCAFSTEEKLQTYLTLIGAQGIGKNIFVEEFLGYYHGSENLNKPKTVELRFNDKCSRSTLIFFDENVMNTLADYNEMKCYVNRTLSYEEKGKPIYMGENFANIVWSCNNKDSMQGMSREDRRFKIIPITDKILIDAPIYDQKGNIVDYFNSTVIKDFVNSKEIKNEFVLLLLSLKDYVNDTNESKNDINTISLNEIRDTIFEESRSLEFIDILDVLKNVYNDYNETTGKLGGKVMTYVEKESIGEIYRDYIPLSKIEATEHMFYTYKIPFATVRKVIEARTGQKGKPMSIRYFNRNLDCMPPKTIKSTTVSGMQRDIHIRLSKADDINFKENLLPILQMSEKKESHKKREVSEENPFD